MAFFCPSIVGRKPSAAGKYKGEFVEVLFLVFLRIPVLKNCQIFIATIGNG